MFHPWLVAIFNIKRVCISLIKWTKVTKCVFHQWKTGSVTSVTQFLDCTKHLEFCHIYSSICHFVLKATEKSLLSLECWKNFYSCNSCHVWHARQPQLFYSGRKLIIYNQIFLFKLCGCILAFTKIIFIYIFAGFFLGWNWGQITAPSQTQNNVYFPNFELKLP